MAERDDRFAGIPIHPIGHGALTAFVCFVMVWPYTGAVQPGLWSFVVGVLIVVLTLSGIVARFALARMRQGLQSALVIAIQAVMAVLTCTATLASETALLGLVPTGQTLRLIGLRLQQSSGEVLTGVAPIPATLPIATLLGATFAVVFILLDQLLAARLVLLAVVLSSVVGVLPILISFGAVNIAWFLMQALAVLLVLRFGARHDPHAPKGTSAPVAVFAGAFAVVAALLLAPILPVAAALPGTGPTLAVDADLRLGDDLRRPEGIEALTLVTSAARAPYLRMATLSRFSGDVWRPDRPARVPLRDGFGDREWGEQIKTVTTKVSVRVLGISSERLPVPYAPEKITGLEGVWSAVRDNRTVLSLTDDVAGADYTVTAATPSPSREQIRAAVAGGAEVPDLPDSLPRIISELADQVTANAENDYDRLIALQDWFRRDFSYSLNAPVEDGFDGTGAEAIATFLQKKTGYCIHFAGAFALMASTLDMPVRIVVGYLPGTATNEKRGDDVVYSVSSDQLHSWPEVHFEGIGWVPFEPTATLGVPTAFASEAQGGGNGDGPDAPTPSAGPTAAPSSSASGRPDQDSDAGGAGQGALRRLDPTPVMLTVFAALFVLLLPLLVREVRRTMRIARARAGDAMAGWNELSDTLIDLGLPAPEADTARMRADALALHRGVDPQAMAPLVDAVERASYAGASPPASNLANPLRVVLAQLAASVDARDRLRARLLPASLLPRRRR